MSLTEYTFFIKTKPQPLLIGTIALIGVLPSHTKLNLEQRIFFYTLGKNE